MGLRFRFSPPGFQGARRLTGFPNWAAKELEERFSFSMLKEWEVVEFSVGALLNHVSLRYCAMGNNREPHLANCVRPRATWGVGCAKGRARSWAASHGPVHAFALVGLAGNGKVHPWSRWAKSPSSLQWPQRTAVPFVRRLPR